jgi:hypothetical protein
MLVGTSKMHLIWTVISETPSSDLLVLPDTALIRLILQQVARRTLLSAEEIHILYGYIGAKITLIRDIADSRLTPETIRVPIYIKLDRHPYKDIQRIEASRSLLG